MHSVNNMQSTHDYMLQWIPRRKEFLGYILSREAPRTNLGLCSKCKIRTFKIRCKDCLYTPLLCVECCRDTHRCQPFHRIEEWKGTYFSPAWLWQTGLSIHLGHGGNHCPSNYDKPRTNGDQLFYTTTETREAENDPNINDEDSDMEELNPEYSWSSTGRPPKSFMPGASTVVIVHTNAVHHLSVFLCTCQDAPDALKQYFEMGFYPSTYKQIETVFTFQVLDDYLLQNLECHTSCHHYYSKIRRMTNSVFPLSVPVSVCKHMGLY